MFKFLILIQILITYVNGHGFLYDPVSRGSAWRKHFKTPEDYDDDGLFCGGFNSHWELNNGKCGVCGDAFESNRPHEVNGKFVNKPPTIVQTYEQGDIINVTVNLTANHGGFFIFQLCPAISDDKEVDEDCLNNNNLEIVKSEYYHPKMINKFNIAREDNDLKYDLDRNSDNELIEYDNYEFYDDSQEKENDQNENRIDIVKIKINNRDNLFNPVDLNDHTYDKFKFLVPFENPKSYEIKLKLPNEINCHRCVFRWIYVTGNTWGKCNDSNDSNENGKIGCGKQEEFRNCADISIH